MTAKYDVRDRWSGVFLMATIGFASTLACSSPHAAEVPRTGPTHPDPGGNTPSRLTPELEHTLVRDFLTSSGSVNPTPGFSITKTANDLFGPLFASQLRLKADFKCFKSGCLQETIVSDWTAVERLDHAILSPGSPFLGLPGTVHRGPPIKLPGGGLKVVWTILITEEEYPLLTTALRTTGHYDTRKH